jgi:hypothetical protein
MRKKPQVPWTIRDSAKFHITQEGERHAKDHLTGQAQPQNEGSIPASQADPMPKMPLAPGSRYVEPAPRTATGTSSVAVSNKPKNDSGIPSFHAGAGQQRLCSTA